MRHRLSLPLVFWAAVAAVPVLVAATPLKVGSPAPPLQVEYLLQAPEGTRITWESLHGKAVMLEFWATSCGPCVNAITHLNEMARDLEGEPIRFLALTDENATTVGRFLEKRPITGWVGLDTDRSVFNAYDVLGLPQTILVDGQGVVRARTLPQLVTLEVLRDLAAGRPLNLPESSSPSTSTVLGGSAVEPLFQVSIRPSTTGEKWGRYSPEAYLTAGATISGVLANAHDVPWTRVVLLTELPGQLYDIAVIPAGRKDLVKPLLRQALEAAFHLRARRELRERDVHVLTIDKGHDGKLKESGAGGSGFQTAPGRIEGVNMTGAQIAQSLEFSLGSPVVDESGLKGAYDIRLVWDPQNPTSLTDGLRDQFGLELRQARRRIEVLVVEKAE